MQFERSVLSSILFSPDKIDEISEIISADDFSYEPHKNIFLAMQELRRTDLPIDEEFIFKLSTKARPISEEEILNIANTSPIGDINAYVNEIRNASIKRRLNSFALKIQESTEDESADIEKIIGYLQSELYSITDTQKTHDFRDALDVSTATLEYIKAMKERGNSYLIGLDTGFHELNKMTAGFNEGDLIIIAARPSMGKTTLALNMTQKALDSGKGAVFFSLEMPPEQLMLRMLSAKTSIAFQNLRVGRLLEEEWSRLTYASSVISQAPLFFDDNTSLTIHQLRAKLLRIKTKHPEIGLAVIDYLQLMSGVRGGGGNRHQEVGEISRGLKTIARELKIPIIALSQLNRSLESRNDRRPMLSDLRESGSIEQDADVILFVYRDEIYRLRDEREKAEEARKKGEKGVTVSIQEKSEEEAEIIIGKQRNGPTGMVKVAFHNRYMRFVDMERKMEINYEDASEATQTRLEPNEGGIDMPNI